MRKDAPRTPPRLRVTDDGPSYAEESESESDSDAEIQSKKGTCKGGHPRAIEQFEHVKSWALGKHAQLGDEDMHRNSYEIMRDLIAPSGLKKLLGHKDCEKDITL